MQSIQVCSTMVAEIMYAKRTKTSAARELKGLTYYTPVHYVSLNPIFLQNLRFVGATVIEFRFFNRIPKKKKKKKKKKKNMKNLGKLVL